MARPKAKIDWKKVDRMLQAHCDGTGIASVFGVHPNTLYEACKKKFNMSFSEYSQLKKAEGKDLLRIKQFDMAMSGDRTLLVWLGKQYLGQRENPQSTGDMNQKLLQEVIEMIEKHNE